MTTVSIDLRRNRAAAELALADADAAPKVEELVLRPPRAQDGSAIFELVADCPPLDRNSMYCNLLQATHFADTSVIAEIGDRLVGCITGYRLPADPSVLFVWQVAVSAAGRGRGLAKAMLRELLARHEGAVCHVHTTITSDNKASWALFSSFAKDVHANTRTETMFARDAHFGGAHDDEILLRIGPIAGAAPNAATAPLRRVAGGRDR